MHLFHFHCTKNYRDRFCLQGSIHILFMLLFMPGTTAPTALQYCADKTLAPGADCHCLDHASR